MAPTHGVDMVSIDSWCAFDTGALRIITEHIPRLPTGLSSLECSFLQPKNHLTEEDLQESFLKMRKGILQNFSLTRLNIQVCTETADDSDGMFRLPRWKKREDRDPNQQLEALCAKHLTPVLKLNDPTIVGQNEQWMVTNLERLRKERERMEERMHLHDMTATGPLGWWDNPRFASKSQKEGLKRLKRERYGEEQESEEEQN